MMESTLAQNISAYFKAKLQILAAKLNMPGFGDADAG
jgi:hypothetical protein